MDTDQCRETANKITKAAGIMRGIATGIVNEIATGIATDTKESRTGR